MGFAMGFAVARGCEIMKLEGSTPSPWSRHHVDRHRTTGSRAAVAGEETSGRFSDDRRLKMNVSHLEWIITLGVAVAVLVFDVAIVGRRPHEPSMVECAIYLAIYVGLAAAFGFFVWSYHGSQFGLEFFAGWMTEYSLSADNLLLFVIIMASLAVPKKYRQQTLLV